MKIKREFFQVASVPYDSEGGKVEPEQQPAQRVMIGTAPTTMNDGSAMPGLRDIPMRIVADMPASQLANVVRHPCYACKHFDRSACAQYQRKLQWGTEEERGLLNNMRGALLTTDNARLHDMHEDPQSGDMDVEHALSSLGICHPLSEIHGAPVIVHPTGCCPPEVCNAGNPAGLFVAVSRDAEKRTTAAFDTVMRAAMGQR